MKVLTSWLREFTNPNTSDSELAETLTMTGLEVDGVETIVPHFENVVVGKVLECEKHPNADKLNLCTVDVGSEVLQIICGAKNVRKDLTVCVAKNGAVLPGNFKIKKAKLRGVESNGMICSESEIGLVDSSEGIMELSNDLEIGANIRDILALDDNIIELDITPNRGDCFSILGVAREVGVNYDIDISKKAIDKASITSDKTIKTTVSNKEYCPKYLTRVIEGLDNTIPTPKWMSDKLQRSGFATHSALVDITNYVLLELGQPMHSFDKDNISGDISVRLANNGEKITLLNENEALLNNETLIIADSSKPLAIAGVMGGLESSTTPETTSIVLESAFFDNVLIAGKAREYGLHTESSLRFERGVDYRLPEIAMEYATNLILDICGGNAGVVSTQVSEENLPKQPEITITYAKINQVLGFELNKDWIVNKFNKLNFAIIASDDEKITITAPSYRFDINISADLIEELARLYGYDKLPTAKLSLESNLAQNEKLDIYELKNILTARNYNEVISYSFISPELSAIVGGETIQLLNPISNDLSIMRSSIIAGLLKTAVDNTNRGQSDLKIFETGLCFNGVGADEQIEKIAGLITGNANNNFLDANRDVDFFDLKADVLSIVGNKNIEFIPCENSILQTGQAATILIDGQGCGVIGALHPKVQKQLGLAKCFVFEIDLAKLLAKNTIKYQQFSIYQTATRDISMLFDKDISYKDIIDSIKSLKQKHLIDITLVDVWSGKDIDENKHSLTFSLMYQSQEKTLTDEEVDNPVQKIIKLLTKEYNAEQR